MKVHVVAKRIIDDKRGTLFRGDVVELPDHKANFYRKRGEVEFYETKVLRDRPFLAVGRLSSVSLAAHLSLQTTLTGFENGETQPSPKE